jgi:hypothetical protein
VTGIDSLRNVLELERRKGYTDKAVIGGLDKYLHKQAEAIRQSINDPQLVKGFDELNLAKSNYGSYSVDERQRWIANVLGWLDELEKANKTNSSQESGVSSQKSVVSSQKPEVSHQKAAAEPRQKRKEELDSPITVIRGISTSADKKFAKLNVRTVRLQPEETRLGTYRR